MVMGIIMKLLSHNDERTFMNMIVIFAYPKGPRTQIMGLYGQSAVNYNLNGTWDL